LKIVLFSGFLGDSSDWDFLIPYLGDFEVEAQHVEPYENWHETARNWVRSRKFTERDTLLVGYSLGGRMAAHLAVQWPGLFKGLIAISAHPGLPEDDQEQRRLRIEQDRIWAGRFSEKSSESWEDLLKSWNSQPVFASHSGSDSKNRPRRESPKLRQRCEMQLRNLSLGLQSDLRGPLARCPLPQLWITGKEDTKFDSLAKNLASESPAHIQHISVEHQGHRWPWTAPAATVGPLISEGVLHILKEASRVLRNNGVK
jgi:2-succinyl-6-hydroxy-2,4-cyclohexadiene-1-carboxylate synthase